MAAAQNHAEPIATAKTTVAENDLAPGLFPFFSFNPSARSLCMPFARPARRGIHSAVCRAFATIDVARRPAALRPISRYNRRDLVEPCALLDTALFFDRRIGESIETTKLPHCFRHFDFSRIDARAGRKEEKYSHQNQGRIQSAQGQIDRQGGKSRKIQNTPPRFRTNGGLIQAISGQRRARGYLCRQHAHRAPQRRQTAAGKTDRLAHR